MIKIIDFTNYELSNRNLQYAGRAGEKRGIVFNNEYWFLKFPKNTIGMNKVDGLSYVTSPLSEYIGSNIYRILGYDVHKTLLGVFNDGKRYKVVCACKDFIRDDKNEILIPYTALRNDTNPLIMKRNDESIQSASNINEIIFQLENNMVLGKIENAKERFWEVVIIDMLINNNDRNEDNWGVVKYKDENRYELAPIFDCGNSFYGKTSEERIELIMEDQNKLLSSALNGITAYEDDNEKRISIKDIMNIENEVLKKSCEKVYLNVSNHIHEIENFINEIPNKYNGIDVISELRKEYYIQTFKLRMEHLLKPQS